MEKKVWVLQQLGPARVHLDPVAVIETEDEAKAVVAEKRREMLAEAGRGMRGDKVVGGSSDGTRHWAGFRSGVCADNDFEWEAVAVPVMKPRG